MYLTNRSKIWIGSQSVILHFNAIPPSSVAHKWTAVVRFLKTTSAVQPPCCLIRILWEMFVSFLGRERTWTWRIQQGRRLHTFTWWKQRYLLGLFFLNWNGTGGKFSQSNKIPFPVYSDTRHSKAIYNRPFTLTIEVHGKSVPPYIGKINQLTQDKKTTPAYTRST